MENVFKLCRGKILNFTSLSLFAFLFACNPQGAETVEDLDLVSTSFSQNFDFQTNRTYYMPNRVVTVSDPNNQQTNVILDTTFHQVILDRVASKLNSLGYIRLDTISEVQRPAVIVQVAALATTNTNLYYDNWWNYWGGFYDPFYPGYGFGWNPYPRLYSYSYTTGSVIIEMLDPNNPNVNERQIPSVWVASLSGLLRGSPFNLQNRIISGVDQAFRQSPYL